MERLVILAAAVFDIDKQTPTSFTYWPTDDCSWSVHDLVTRLLVDDTSGPNPNPSPSLSMWREPTLSECGSSSLL